MHRNIGLRIGVVAAVGGQVTGLKLGDAVYSRPDIAKNGGYAEY